MSSNCTSGVGLDVDRYFDLTSFSDDYSIAHNSGFFDCTTHLQPGSHQPMLMPSPTICATRSPFSRQSNPQRMTNHLQNASSPVQAFLIHAMNLQSSNALLDHALRNFALGTGASGYGLNEGINSSSLGAFTSSTFSGLEWNIDSSLRHATPVQDHSPTLLKEASQPPSPSVAVGTPMSARTTSPFSVVPPFVCGASPGQHPVNLAEDIETDLPSHVLPKSGAGVSTSRDAVRKNIIRRKIARKHVPGVVVDDVTNEALYKVAHSTELPNRLVFTCLICPTLTNGRGHFSTLVATGMKRHVLTHNPKPISCPKCSAELCRQDVLFRHLKVVCNGGKRPTAPNKGHLRKRRVVV